uniref:Uncharacterized protein n=1 Tax=Anguilla anguilla TaxID=7936 RepID=A0A0E9SUI5_ANGAN
MTEAQGVLINTAKMFQNEGEKEERR